MNKKNLSLSIILCTLILSVLTGCAGKGEAEKKAYNDELNKYYEKIYTTSVSINDIDTSIDGSSQIFLLYMDIMAQDFSAFSQIETPTRYLPLQELATQAALDMENANALYHEIYSAPDFSSYDQEKADDAYLNYTNAMKILNQIGTSIMADETSRDSSVSEN